LPAASVPRTRIVCVPTASWVYVTRGAHGSRGAPSSAHSNVVPSSLAEKRKVALRDSLARGREQACPPTEDR
jgi:hypothetical protein